MSTCPESQPLPINTTASSEDSVECCRKGRELRARRYNKHIRELRPLKKLFTPDIKRYLKTWLVRRRNHPYPSRTEKKILAYETGLTYIQVCNWFANWRRKLKNTAVLEPKDDTDNNSKTWTTLIKSYNGIAEKNVELISLSSNDSIWNEKPEEETDSFCQVSSTSDLQIQESNETYTKSVDTTTNSKRLSPDFTPCETAPLLKRWLQSAANFQPNPYTKEVMTSPHRFYQDILFTTLHAKEELDAAEALTFLSRKVKSWGKQFSKQ